MRIETVCTGDELLTGLTADTNSTFFQAQLLERTGLGVRRSVVVGDVREDIVEALNAAAARCDAVLVSGGLGPTSDDITAECAAEAAGVPLVESAAALAHLEARLKSRGVAMTPNNRRPARVPESAEVVLNEVGSAPMFVQTRGRCVLFFVPGVPREYRHLVEHHVVPRLDALAAALGAREVRVLRLLKTVRLPESHLDARMQPLVARHPRVTFGYRTHAPENHLKLLAAAPTRDEALVALAAAEADARAALGDHVFAADAETMAGVVLEALRRRGETVAVAESCTGGLVGAELTEVAGASAVFVGGAIAYTERTKEVLADVPSGLLAQFGAVSPETTEAMARGVRARTGATWGLAVTGYAGPGGGDAATPVGTVFVALAGPGEGSRGLVPSLSVRPETSCSRRAAPGAMKRQLIRSPRDVMQPEGCTRCNETAAQIRSPRVEGSEVEGPNHLQPSGSAAIGVAVSEQRNGEGDDGQVRAGGPGVAHGSDGVLSTTVERHTFLGARDRVRRFAAHSALDLLRRTLQEGGPS